jgi:hypothetical protein
MPLIQEQDKTFIPNGLWLQECPLLPTQDPSALWTTQPKAFNLNTKEGKKIQVDKKKKHA